MKRIRTFPYLLPSAERVRAESWKMSAGGELIELPSTLEHWDPNTAVSVARRISVDVDGLLADCHLTTARIVAALTWHSPGTSLRGSGARVAVTTSDPSTSLSVTVRGQDLAQSVRIDAQLMLVDGSPRSKLAPHLSGSILWREQVEIVLEGRGTRYPVEVCDFGERSWLPAGAAWYLDWEPDDLEQPFLGRVRLLINSKHARVREAIESCAVAGATSPASHAILGAIYHDVARVMIMGALANDEFVANAERYPEGSVGRVIWRLLATIGAHDDIGAMATFREERPFAFECQLQERLQLFAREG